MKLITIRFFVIVSIQLTLSLILKAQTPLLLNKDSLVGSLNVFLEDMDSNKIIKEVHFLLGYEFDYYHSINSPRFAYEVKNVLAKINLPFEHSQLVEITFAECYDWTEAFSTWFITLIDKADNHFIYFYEDNLGINNIKMYAVKKGEDYFYRLAENLYRNGGCKEKNEDYIITGKIVNGKFVSYFSSQAYHRMDIVFFNDLLKALSD